MKLFLCFAFAAVFTQNSPAQFLYNESDSRASSMGGAFVSLENGSSAVFCNPAGLGSLNHSSASVFFEPALYGLNEITTAALTYAQSFGFANIGIGLRTFGFDLYRESKLVLSAGGSSGEMIRWGLSAVAYNVAVQDYGSAFAFGLDAGVQADIGGMFSWGFTAKNITGARIGQSGQKISRSYATGLGVSPAENGFIMIDLEKETWGTVNVRFGGEFNPVKPLFIRAGISTEPVSYTAGIGVVYGIVGFDYAAVVTEPLGLTNRFELTFAFH